MSYTVSALAEKFFSCITHTNAPGTIGYYRRHIDAFAKHIGEITISDLKPWHLLSWGNTWHRIQAIQRLFHWAHDEAEIIPTNPFRKVKRPRPGRRKRILKREESLSLFRAADRTFRDFMLAMRETIARPQEVRAFQWDFLHVENEGESLLTALKAGRAFFLLETYKGQSRRLDPDSPRIILMTPRLGRLLHRIATSKEELHGPIFRNSKGHAWTSNAVRLRMKRLRKRCKLIPDARGENVVAYTLRHTSATRAAAKGVRDRVLADLMGHTSTRTTARYQHLEIGDLRDAMKRLSSDRSPGRQDDNRKL